MSEVGRPTESVRSHRLMAGAIVVVLVLVAGPFLTARPAAASSRGHGPSARLLERAEPVAVHHRTRQRSHATGTLRHAPAALQGGLGAPAGSPPTTAVLDPGTQPDGVAESGQPTSRAPPR